MLKYISKDVVFREIPGRVCLCYSLTRCPFHCHNCHSPFLREDIGKELTLDTIVEDVRKNPMVDCILLMGGDGDYKDVEDMFMRLSLLSSILPRKRGWYSGREEIPQDLNLDVFDYIKIGPYIEEKGGLDSKTTNQKLYHIHHQHLEDEEFTTINTVEDITKEFWK